MTTAPFTGWTFAEGKTRVAVTRVTPTIIEIYVTVDGANVTVLKVNDPLARGLGAALMHATAPPSAPFANPGEPCDICGEPATIYKTSSSPGVPPHRTRRCAAHSGTP